MKVRSKFKLLVLLLTSFFGYTIFIYAVPVGSDAENDDIHAGKMIWQEKNCTACHQLYGLGGYLGPDLTNTYSDSLKGPLYIGALVRGGTSIMPSFALSDKEMNQLLAFLRHVDASGKSDPKRFKFNPNGTIERR